jgi:hypothetical protein
MAVDVSQAVYNQIVALRDGALSMAAAAHTQAEAAQADADRHNAEAADYAAMLDDLTVRAGD